MFNWLKDLLAHRVNAKETDELFIPTRNTSSTRSGATDDYFRQALTLQDLGQHEDALACFDRTLQIQPTHVDALNKRGITLRMLKRYDEAIGSIDAALTLEPDHVPALNNRGNALQDLKQFEGAVIWYDRALHLRPDYADAWYNRGLALAELDRFEDAIRSFDSALQFKSDHVDALTNRGLALRSLNRLREALACFEQALQMKPDHPEAHFNEGSCRLLMGDLELGWQKYHWRWKCKQFNSINATLTCRPWLGDEPIRGKTLFVHAEQGLGDTIHFCRYIKLLAERGATVLLAAQAPLTSLLADLDGVHMIYAMGESLPEFDLYCPLLSLPLIFNTRLNSIPANVPYLHSDPDRTALWRRRLGHGTLPRVGIAWAGSLIHENDRNRSIALSVFSRIVSRHAQFASLQKEVRESDKAELGRRGDILFFGDFLDDFADTAALVESMDLVITVDTSVAHLAGALGKPVWILLPFIPDWRWMLDRSDSPWYPSARLFRQPRMGDWDSVIAAVANELGRFAKDAA
ncbi:tetratricopeptide repeat-containing glycosyltransferase family protein [Herbaspirillum sp. ST 5-3]|uniref:tetratricopeptide repeat-containing glycosyltransferase family protein n=1 Tax=Oxalobacteraceae TaxID=75682 RepID=UPI0010A453AA|nr:tetratricopeptide repeat-containing glycosyltransferase family protein [Herbaspirillum sp. ST 5-3]